MRNSILLALSAATCLFVGTPGCAFDASLDEGTAAASAEQPLWAKASYLWPGSPAVIPVCWQGSLPPAQFRGWVAEVIQGQWGRYGNIAFTGWNTVCQPTSLGIHLHDKVGQGVWHSEGGYSKVNGLDEGLIVDSATTCPGYASAEHCVKALALHEFGHALGFYHEEERASYTGDRCGLDVWSAGPEYGAYDIDSVMSYKGQAAPHCTPVDTRGVRTWKDTLSANDIAAVQSAYGKRVNGQVVSLEGKCLTGNSGANGALPFLDDCKAASPADQTWSLVNGRNLKNVGRGTCLDVESGGTANGTEIQLWSCLDNTNQRFELERVAIRGWGGKCLDLPNGNAVSGQKLQMWSCLGEWSDATLCPTSGECLPPAKNASYSNENQRWSRTAAGEIRFGSVDSTWCVTYGSTDNRSPLYLATCNGSAHQKFDFKNGQIVLNAAPTKCVDVQAPFDSEYKKGIGGPIDGGAVQVFDCRTEQLNQKWWTTGAIQFGDLDRIVRRTSDANGASPTLYTRLSPLPATDKWDLW